MELSERLHVHLSQFHSPPYLFVGSGVSRRYLGLPNWDGLLADMCAVHDIDHGYLSSSVNGDPALLATAMAEVLHPRWWKEDRYKDSREKYASAALSLESPLKIEIARYIAERAQWTTDLNLLNEIELLRKAVIDGVVTTNWDGFLEVIFPTFKPYVGQEALLFSQTQGIAEIYKIHGSQDDAGSLVVTSGDYDEFNRRNPYLASKLLTFFVENPIVFLGYSLTDPNIREIIESILACLSTQNVKKLADRLVFVQWDEATTVDRFERTVILTAEGRSLPVQQVTTASMSSVFRALSMTQRTIPAKLLRMLKEQVFTLVHSTEPTQRIFVQDIGDETLDENIEFAIGVGIQEKLREVGYTALTRMHILRDIVFNDGGLIARSVVERTLPELLKKSNYVPTHKYVSLSRQSPDFDESGLASRVSDALARRIPDFAVSSGTSAMARTARTWPRDFRAFAEQVPAARVLEVAAYLPVQALVPEQIQRFLVENFELAEQKVNTNFFKLACIYDYLMWSGSVEEAGR